MQSIDKHFQLDQVRSDEDIEQVAQLHSKVFSNNLAGAVGINFLKYYFKKIVYSSNGIIYAYKSNGKVIGFIAGLSSKKGFEDISFYLRAGIALFCQMLTKPSLIKQILRQIKRSLTAKERHDAELMSIAIVEQCQGKGLGKNLVLKFEEFLKTKNVTSYEVYTDIDVYTALEFYKKLGFKFRREIALFELRAHEYTKELA